MRVINDHPIEQHYYMSSTKRDSVKPFSSAQSLSDCVEKSMQNYFADLDGHDASGLYDLVITQVEKPLFEIVLKQYNGNITHAAQALGLNRGTVLGRLKKYGITR